MNGHVPWEKMLKKGLGMKATIGGKISMYSYTSYGISHCEVHAAVASMSAPGRQSAAHVVQRT